MSPNQSGFDVIGIHYDGHVIEFITDLFDEKNSIESVYILDTFIVKIVKSILLS